MIDLVIQNFSIMGKFISHDNMQRDGIAHRNLEIRKIMYTVYGHKESAKYLDIFMSFNICGT